MVEESCTKDVMPSRVDSLVMMLDNESTADDVAEIDLRIENHEREIDRLRRVRDILCPTEKPREVVVRKNSILRNGHSPKKKPQTRNKLSGLALEAHNRRVSIARVLARSNKGMTIQAISDATQIKFPGIMRTMICPYFAQLSHDGHQSVFLITDKGKELAKGTHSHEQDAQ